MGEIPAKAASFAAHALRSPLLGPSLIVPLSGASPHRHDEQLTPGEKGNHGSNHTTAQLCSRHWHPNGSRYP